MSETYHLEALGFDVAGRPAAIKHRETVRSASFEQVRRRAVRLLQRTKAPQWTGGKVEVVRIADGSGAEMFRWSIWDELTTASGR